MRYTIAVYKPKILAISDFDLSDRYTYDTKTTGGVSTVVFDFDSLLYAVVFEISESCAQG